MQRTKLEIVSYLLGTFLNKSNNQKILQGNRNVTITGQNSTRYTEYFRRE